MTSSMPPLLMSKHENLLYSGIEGSTAKRPPKHLKHYAPVALWQFARVQPSPVLNFVDRSRAPCDPRRRRPPNNLGAPGMPTKGLPSRKAAAAVVRATPRPWEFTRTPIE